MQMPDEIDLSYELPFESDDFPTTSDTPEFEALLIKLAESDPARTRIIDTFRRGLGPVADIVDIYTVYENRYQNPIQDKEVFRRIGVNVARQSHGLHKVEICFFGGSRDQLIDVINPGFYGTSNIILAKSTCASISAFRCVADDRGIYHVLACNLHVGRAMVYDVPFLDTNISQKPPVNVDIMSSLREFLVFDCHKNSYVLPTYIISFGGQRFKDLHGHVHGLISQANTRTPLNILVAYVTLLTTTGLASNALNNAVDDYEVDGDLDVLVQKLTDHLAFGEAKSTFHVNFSPLLTNAICIAPSDRDLRDALMAAMMQ